jgi:hypothetical protein
MSMKSSPRSADDELDRLVGLGITRQQVEPGGDCLDPEVLASYADGGLPASEVAEAEAHLARCRDCRRALALQVESDPFGASTTISIASIAASATDGSAPGTTGRTSGASTGTGSRTGAVSGRLPASSRVVHSAKTWLPLAAALVVATGLWFAFARSRQPAQYSSASVPGHLSARNEPSVAEEAAARQAAPAPSRRPSGDRVEPSGALPPSEVALGGAPSSAPVDRVTPLREIAPQREASRGGASAASAPASASGALRTREARRDEFAAGARSEAESDRLARPAAPAPPPPPAALADAAAPSRTAGAAGREGQANQNLAPQQAAPQQTAPQQYAINQQTGPMANLNVASPPPAKTDERRPADAKKAEANEKANEKSPGDPSNVKSADGAFTKAIEEPKSVARAKAAPQSAAAGAAPAEAAATKGADAASGIVAGASPAAGGKPSATASGDAAPGSTAATGTADRGTSGARAGDTSTREVSEVVTIVTAAPASIPVLRSTDGARWWRIRAPSTIEGSADRGATWTVEYSDPSSILVRGAAGSKSGCWMIGANGLVLRTRPNGGWERVTQPTTRGLVRLTATDHLIATVTDDQGRAYRTTDGGVTWR